MIGLSVRRVRSLLRKEWIQVRRDPMTLRLLIALPMMQLLLFGYAINANPKHLPTGLLFAEPSKYERTLVAALQNTGYYDIRTLRSEQAAEKGLAEGDLLFVPCPVRRRRRCCWQAPSFCERPIAHARLP